MKRSLSIIALLLAVIMIAMCCVACGDEDNSDTNSQDTEKKADQTPIATVTPIGDSDLPTDAPAQTVTASGVVGKWLYVAQFSELLEGQLDAALEQVPDEMQEFYQEMFKCFNGVSLDMIIEFDSDSNYHFGMDESSVRTAMDQIIANFKAQLPAMLASIGTTMEAFEAALAQQGMTVDSYIDAAFSQSMDIESMLKQSESSGTYRYEGDRLYLSNANGEIKDDDYATVEVSSNKIVVTAISGESNTFTEAMLPMNFIRL